MSCRKEAGGRRQEAGGRGQEEDDVLMLVRPDSRTCYWSLTGDGEGQMVSTLSHTNTNTASFKPTALNYRGDSWTELYKYS